MENFQSRCLDPFFQVRQQLNSTTYIFHSKLVQTLSPELLPLGINGCIIIRDHYHLKNSIWPKQIVEVLYSRHRQVIESVLNCTTEEANMTVNVLMKWLLIVNCDFILDKWQTRCWNNRTYKLHYGEGTHLPPVSSMASNPTTLL